MKATQDNCHQCWHGIVCVAQNVDDDVVHLSSMCRAFSSREQWTSGIMWSNLEKIMWISNTLHRIKTAPSIYTCSRSWAQIFWALAISIIHLPRSRGETNTYILIVLTCSCCVSSNPSGKSVQLVSSCWDREVTKCFAFITNRWLHTAIGWHVNITSSHKNSIRYPLMRLHIRKFRNFTIIFIMVYINQETTNLKFIYKFFFYSYKFFESMSRTQLNNVLLLLFYLGPNRFRELKTV